MSYSYKYYNSHKNKVKFPSKIDESTKDFLNEMIDVINGYYLDNDDDDDDNKCEKIEKRKRGRPKGSKNKKNVM